MRKNKDYTAQRLYAAKVFFGALPEMDRGVITALAMKHRLDPEKELLHMVANLMQKWMDEDYVPTPVITFVSPTQIGRKKR